MPWTKIAGADGLDFVQGKITFALGLLAILVAAGRGIDRSDLVRWMTVVVGCSAGVIVATLARMKIVELEGMVDGILRLFFAVDPVERGLRVTLAGGIVTAAMSLLNVIPVPDREWDEDQEASFEGVERGQS
jgi:hypothetical protein